jgi:hypothetical protein
VAHPALSWCFLTPGSTRPNPLYILL